MADNPHHVDLDQLLIDVGRSFLQYVGQCWPWTEVNARAERKRIDALVARQRAQIARLTDLLIRRNGAVDFGAYPNEYTDLHYVALDHLLSQLIENERALVAVLEGAYTSSTNDQEAAGLLEGMLVDERDNLKQLQDLAASRTSAGLG